MLRGATRLPRNSMRHVALPFMLLSICLSSLFLTVATENGVARAIDFADPAFQAQWQIADKPVQDGSTARSWVWGLTVSEGRREPYAETPGGQRLVQYFDKARMEINNPNASPADKYFVTNGLLVNELVSGQIQLGSANFVSNPNGPSLIPVAGDPDSPVSLTYASFKSVASLEGNNRADNQTGQAVINTLSKDGKPGQNPAVGSYGVTNTYYENDLGHNIPNVFWSFLNQQGLIFVNGVARTGPILEWQVAAGLPLTEAYWSRAVIGGQEKDVLVQMFQRRALTYTPTNDTAFKVEMGNVGAHYFKWRYTTPPPPAPTPTPAPAQPVAPTSNIPAGPADWSGPAQAYAVARPVVRVRPTDGQVWVIGENKGAAGIFASTGPNFATVLNLKPGSGGERVKADFDSDGNLHVFWQEGSDIGLQTYYARVNADGKQAWVRNMAKELAGNNSTGLPSVYFNPANKRLYLVHEENPQTVVFYESADEGQTWTNRYVIAGGNANQTIPAVVGDAAGNVHVVWGRKVGDTTELFAADRFGNNWTAPVNLTNYNGRWSTPPVSLAVAPNGDTYAAWISPGNNSAGVGFARYDGAARRWTGPRDNISKTSAGFGSFKTVRITVSSNGSIWIGFTLDNPGSADRSGGYYMLSNDGGANWSEVRTVFRQTNADAGDIWSIGGNIYFVGLFNRQSLFSYRRQ